MISSAVASDDDQLYTDHPLNGHLGYSRTQGRIQQRYKWLRMWSHISRYVRFCKSCQMLMPLRRKPGGLIESTWAYFGPHRTAE